MHDEEASRDAVSLSELDLGLLALFVGQEANRRVQDRLERAGFRGLRISHGYFFQHLISGERSVGELAALQGVSQQAVSKVVRELTELGYVESVAFSEDARVRKLRLSARGTAAVQTARKLRARLSKELLRGTAPKAQEHAREVLCLMLTRLGGVASVQGRRVRAPELEDGEAGARRPSRALRKRRAQP